MTQHIGTSARLKALPESPFEAIGVEIPDLARAQKPPERHLLAADESQNLPPGADGSPELKEITRSPICRGGADRSTRQKVSPVEEICKRGNLGAAAFV